MGSPSASPVYRLMYMSTAVHELRDAELEAILTAARAFNAERQITGMLLYVGRQFVQYLEGGEFAVESLYRRIERDPRHAGVIRLFSGPYERRVFRDWSMGFKHYDKAGEAPIAGAIDLCRQSIREAMPEGAPEEVVLFMENLYRDSRGLGALG